MHPLTIIAIGAVMSAAPACSHGQSCADPSCVAATATAEAPPPDPADQWLDRIEKHAAQIKSLKATLRYERIQGLVGDAQRRFGTLLYHAGPPARFAVHFDRLLVDVPGETAKKLIRQNRWYIFDGTWLVEKLDDRKQFFKRQVVAPDAPKQRRDPLALGQGPFPLPLRFRKDQVLKRFGVTLIEDDRKPNQEGTPDLVHLRFVPHKGFKVNATKIDLWYDRKTLLPARALSIDESENESIFVLSKPVVNEEIDSKAFDTSVPTSRQWTVEITPWRKPTPKGD